jgi:hypothetical protein
MIGLRQRPSTMRTGGSAVPCIFLLTEHGKHPAHTPRPGFGGGRHFQSRPAKDSIRRDKHQARSCGYATFFQVLVEYGVGFTF